MGVPTLEKAPGIPEPWLGYWRATLRQLQKQGTWVVAERPLLDEYIYALRGASEAREAREAGPYDKHSRRALAFADALGVTPKSRKALGVSGNGSEQDNPFAELDADAEIYEFAPRPRADRPA